MQDDRKAEEGNYAGANPHRAAGSPG